MNVQDIASAIINYLETDDLPSRSSLEIMDQAVPMIREDWVGWVLGGLWSKGLIRMTGSFTSFEETTWTAVNHRRRP